MIERFFVEGKDMEERIVDSITYLGEIGDVRVNVNDDIKVREGEEGIVKAREHESVGCTAFEEDMNIVKVEIVVEEGVILDFIEDKVVEGEWDDTEGGVF